MPAPRTEIPIVVLNPNSPYNPVSGASAVILNRSGLTTATVYETESGVTVKTQPLTTDSAGRLDGWLARGAYVAQISVPGSPTFSEPLDSAPGADGGVDASWLGFDVATQVELNTHTALTTTAHGGLVASGDARLTDQRVPTDLSVSDGKVAVGAAIQGSKLDTGDGRLVQKTDIVPGTTNSLVEVTSTSYVNVTGATITFTPDVNCLAIVHASFRFKVNTASTGGNASQGVYGTLTVDNNAETSVARAYVEKGAGGGGSDQATIEVTSSQEYRVALNGGSSHTLKLQAKKESGSGNCYYWGTDTKFTYQLVAQ